MTDRPDEPAGALPDMGSLFGMALEMQQQLADAQASAAEQLVEGVAGGGVVRVAVTGGMAFRSVTIDPAAVDPDDVEMLQDLVLAALHDAVDQVEALQAAANPLASMDLGSLGGMLGLGGPSGVVDEDDEDEDLGDLGKGLTGQG
ncbi:MAG: YbaB/EbfC family nucleoid-associated protein [Acidimicrobiales bacterium]|jgi:hypothetical protein|nr:YbaB/EbfC family nucleoid-associated protein [Acidimicrobiales bacterium]